MTPLWGLGPKPLHCQEIHVSYGSGIESGRIYTVTYENTAPCTKLSPVILLPHMPSTRGYFILAGISTTQTFLSLPPFALSLCAEPGRQSPAGDRHGRGLECKSSVYIHTRMRF